MSNHDPRNALALTVLAAVTLVPLSTPAAVVWNEGTQGDLSNDRSAPTALAFSSGSNEIIATSQSGDREYVTFNVPAGHQLSSVVLVSYAGVDGTAFFGIQRGTAFTEPPTGTVVANLLGYAHFGPVPGNVGSDILPAVGNGANAQGFTPPLEADSYALWMQQAGSTATYRFDFLLTPIPEPRETCVYAAAGLLLAGWTMRRLRT